MLARSISALTVAALALAGAGASASAKPATTGAVGFAHIAIDSAASFPSPTSTAGRHQFVILQAWKQDVARQLKASNPNLKVLVYKNMSFVACDAHAAQQYLPQGVRCGDVLATNPEWLLRDAAGARLTSGGYPWLSLADVGSRSYQDAWAANVIAEAKAEGWDGVFLDDVNSTLKYHLEPSRVAKYPSEAAWAAATRSMIATVGPRLRRAGFLAIANICCTREHLGVWKDWLRFLSGGMDETFAKWGRNASEGYIWDWGASGWKAQLDEVAEAESQQKYFLGVSQSGAADPRAARYGLATMLLAANGRSTFTMASDYTNENWFPEYEAAGRLGAPAGDYRRVGVAYRRDFVGGVVLVNPGQAAVTVDLGGSYALPDGTAVSSLALEPTSGALLLRTDASPPVKAVSPGSRMRLGRIDVRVERFRGGRRVSSATAGNRVPSRARLRVRGRVQSKWAHEIFGGRRVAIMYRPYGGTRWRYLATARLDAEGRFAANPIAPRARVIRVRAVARPNGKRISSPSVRISIHR